MHQSSIQVNIGLDDQKIPQNIKWSASDSTATEAQEARAMMLTFGILPIKPHFALTFGPRI